MSQVLLKNILYIWKNITILVLQIFTSVFHVFITALLSRLAGHETQLHPLTIDLKPYKNDPVILLSDLVNDNTSLSKEFVDNYEGLFEDPSSQNGNLQKTDSIRDYILGLSMSELVDFNYRCLAGVTVDNENITAWFNNQPYHTIPLTINMVFNALLRRSCGNCSIQVTNAPLPFTMENRLLLIKSDVDVASEILEDFELVMFTVPAFYVIFYIRERASSFKLLQFISGTNVWIYWTAAFVVDSFTFIITIILSLLVPFAFQIDGWFSETELAAVFILLLLFIWSILPIVYLFSRTTDISSKGFAHFFTLSLILGMYSHISSTTTISNVDTDVRSWFFMLMPQYAMIIGLYRLYTSTTIFKVNISMHFCSLKLIL